MILVKLEGGLGNQMFQYALAKKLSLKLNTEILLDINLYTKDIALTHPRSYGLSHLNIKAKIATDKEIKNIRYRYGILIHKLFRRFESIVLQKKHIKFEKSIFNKSGDISLEGFWQSEKYFKDIREILLKDFTLKNQLSSSSKELKLKISNEQNSVSLHVRRTDYVANEHNIRFYGSHCNQEYYTKALSMICNKINTDNIHVFIFSDDIKWVKENLEIPYEKTYISEDDMPDYERLFQMSYCNHHIIANSTFGWWGAWLDNKKGKIVVAPSIWIPGIDLPISDIIPDEWIKI